MSTTKILLKVMSVALFAMAVFTSCTKEVEVVRTNQETVYVTDTIYVTPTGMGCIYGTVVERYGNWMPVFVPDDPSHGERPIVRDVYVYEYTKDSDLDSITRRQCTTHYPIGSMPKQLVARATPDTTGFYAIPLAPGTYSVFLLDEGRLYCNLWNGDGGMCAVTVDSVGAIVRKNLVLDHADY